MDKLVIPAGPQIEVYTPAVDPFDQGIAALQAEGLPLWSARDLGETRRRGGAQHSISREGSWVSQGFVYATDRDADILVLRGDYNPLLQHPKEATDAHRSGKEFVAQQFAELRECAFSDPTQALQSGVLLLPRKDVRDEIASGDFANYALPAFLFEDQAQPYGAFLQGAGIETVPLYVVGKDFACKQDKPFARVLWVGGLDWSSLGGDGDLHNGIGRVRGVRRVEGPAERAAPGAPLETKVAVAQNTPSHAVEIGDGFARIDGQLYIPVPKQALEGIVAKK